MKTKHFIFKIKSIIIVLLLLNSCKSNFNENPVQEINAIEIANDKDYIDYYSVKISIATDINLYFKQENPESRSIFFSKIQKFKENISLRSNEQNKEEAENLLKDLGVGNIDEFYNHILQLESLESSLIKKYPKLNSMGNEQKVSFFEEVLMVLENNSKGKRIGNGRVEDACGQKLSSCNNKAYAEYAVIGVGCVGAVATGIGFWLGVGCAVTNGWYLNAQLDDCQSDYALCIQPK